MIDSEGSGIVLNGNNNWINNNIIAENEGYGIFVDPHYDHVTNNIISNNSIVFNGWDGIAIWGHNHDDNQIYHNDILKNKRINARDNSNNIWDNGYPSGGNYFDDYNGNDSNGDGIGDTSYYIHDGNNLDRYPLINPLKEYGPIHFKRRILRFVFNKKELTYFETKELFINEVLENTKYLNDNILGKFYRKDITND